VQQEVGRPTAVELLKAVEPRVAVQGKAVALPVAARKGAAQPEAAVPPRAVARKAAAALTRATTLSSTHSPAWCVKT
jgi:hypothetical protein